MTRPTDPSDLPEPLSRHLRALNTPPPFPSERNAAILAAARQAHATHRPRFWRILAPLGIAASIALAVGLLWPSPTPQASAYARTGDIRDAFYLARHIKAHQTLDTRWDINGDGKIDEQDTQALAYAAVNLEARAREKPALQPSGGATP